MFLKHNYSLIFFYFLKVLLLVLKLKDENVLILKLINYTI